MSSAFVLQGKSSAPFGFDRSAANAAKHITTDPQGSPSLVLILNHSACVCPGFVFVRGRIGLEIICASKQAWRMKFVENLPELEVMSA
jgi:hypothetical protein